MVVWCVLVQALVCIGSPQSQLAIAQLRGTHICAFPAAGTEGEAHYHLFDQGWRLSPSIGYDGLVGDPGSACATGTAATVNASLHSISKELSLFMGAFAFDGYRYVGRIDGRPRRDPRGGAVLPLRIRWQAG